MKVTDQGVGPGKPKRYQAVPRTLIFLTRRDEQGREWVLLLKGAADKRLWANRYNGLGGHVEPDEDLLAAAERELAEEAGVRDVALHLRGVIHIQVAVDDPATPGILVFVFVGQVQDTPLVAGREGEPVWIPADELARFPLVDDLYQLIPLLLQGTGFVYGHYHPGPDGTMQYRFRVEGRP